MRKALLISALLLLASAPAAADPTPRILIVGDSWAMSITAENRDGFPSPDVFDDVLEANGLGRWETRGEVTAWGGRKASGWAKPEHLSEIQSELRRFPSIDAVHLIIGGNDYLAAVQQPDFRSKTAEERGAVWDAIAANVKTIVEACLAVRPDIRVLLADYDYLDASAAHAFWKMDFHGATPRELNAWFVELGERKRAVAASTDRCEYLANWGTLQYWFGDPPQQVQLPGGDVDAPMPPGISPDGIHPNADAHAKLLQNAIDQFYRTWLSPDAAGDS